MNLASNILLVDQAAGLQNFNNSSFKQFNFIQVLTESECMLQFAYKDIDMVIVNLQVAKANGFKIAKNLNQKCINSLIPIVFVSSKQISNKEAKFIFKIGALDILIQPINPEIVSYKIISILKTYKRNKKQDFIQTNLTSIFDLFDSFSVLVIVINQKMDIVYLNNAVCDKLGYTKKELDKTNIMHLHSTNNLVKLEDIYANNYTKRNEFSYLTLLEKSGIELTVKTKSWQVEFGGYQYKVIFYVDISKEQNVYKKYLLEFEQNEKYLIISSYPSLTILDINKRYLAKLGFTRDEVIGKSIKDFSFAKNTNLFNKINTEIQQNIVIKDVEIQMCTKAGVVIDFLFSGALVSDNGKQYFISEVIDESHLITTERMLKESNLIDEKTQRIARYGKWEWDINQNIVIWSKEMYRILDIDKNDFNGSPDYILGILHPDDKGIYANILENSLLRGGTSKMEYRVIHNNGSVHYINSEWEIELDKSGYPIKGSGIIQDITVNKEFQLSLKISDEKYKTMLNASPDGIILINLKEEITEVSEIGLELIGVLGRSEVLGKQFSEYVSFENIDIFKMIIEKTINDGLIQNVELKLLKKNGTVFVSETSGTLIQRQDGTPISFMFIIRDISQRKKNEAKQIFADRMANLGEMASGMAHEINQPLNIISMTMDKILFEFDKAKSISENLIKLKSDKIFENIGRIKNIIDHVRSFSRTNNDYVLSEFSVNENIEKTIPMFSEQMKYHDIKMILKLENDLPKILGNTYKFEQVLINLLLNAKDALLERKGNEKYFNDMQIAINSYTQNSNVFIEVIDNGVGIRKDDHEKILLPFYTTKEEGKGTGLGLSICYQLIKEMGGVIYITSDHETGTKFKIQL